MLTASSLDLDDFRERMMPCLRIVSRATRSDKTLDSDYMSLELIHFIGGLIVLNANFHEHSTKSKFKVDDEKYIMSATIFMKVLKCFKR